MAYASPMKIANGLVLDFTVDNADTAADTFLGLNASGEVTQFASVPRSRVSGGGNITEATSSVLSITGGTAAVLTSGLTIQVLQAGAAQSGYLSTTDWNTFNNKLGTSLTSAYIYVGNGSNVATGVAVSGDITMSNAGVVAIASGVIVNTDINASAAIAVSKLAAVTASRVLGSDGSGFIQALDTATYPSLTELSYVKGVTSAIQTQLNNRLSVTLTSPTNGDVITYNGAAWVNSPSSTGVPTAGTTAQILRKIDNTNYNTEWHTLVAADITDVSSTAAELNLLDGVTTTTAQFNFLNTLSGDVQAQLAAKVGTSLTQNYMLVGDASNIVTPLAPGTNGYVLTSVSGVPTWVSPGVGGTVTSVAASGGTTGMSFTGSPITTSGTLTLTGTLAIANGGTGLTALGTANQLIRVNAGATALEYFTHAFGDMVLASTQTNSGAKTFLDNTLLMRNVANTFSSRFTNTNSAARVYTLPDIAQGTILLGGNGSSATNIISSDTYIEKTGSGTGIRLKPAANEVQLNGISALYTGQVLVNAGQVFLAATDIATSENAYIDVQPLAISGYSNAQAGGISSIYFEATHDGNFRSTKLSLDDITGAVLSYTDTITPANNASLEVFNGKILTAGDVNIGAGKYLNFGGSTLSSGYGFRDNAGTMEFKNSGVSWLAINRLNALLAATASNDINNVDFTQTWRWNSIAGGSGLIISSNSSLNTDGSRLLDIDFNGADSAGGYTHYAGKVVNRRTGGGTNVALQLNANGGTTNYALTATGIVRLEGDAFTKLLMGNTITAGSVLADFQSTTEGILVPRVTTIASVATPVNGMVVYDATTNLWNFRQAGAWVNLGSGSGIGGSTGSVDNSILRSDGTGGATLQASSLFIDDSANLTLGTASLAGNRTFTVSSSDTSAGLYFLTKANAPIALQSTDYTSKSSFDVYQRDVAISRWSTTEGAYLSIERLRGTVASPTVINNGDSLGIIQFQGYDGSGMQAGVQIQAISNGTVGAGSIPTDLSFKVGDGGAGTIERFRIYSTGAILHTSVDSAPSGSPSGGVYEYVDDVGSSAEKFIKTESGAVVNISGLLTPVTESGTTITLTEAHRGRIILCTNSGVVTVTVGTSLPDGWNCILLATNATGTITLSAGGATLNGTTSTTAQFESLTLINYGSDTYICKLG